MEKASGEWIDKLFVCMDQFYGERWRSQFSSQTETICKVMWQSALTGLSYDEIKKTLLYLKRHAQDPIAKPPHQIEFYHHAKNHRRIHINYSRTKNPICDRAIADAALQEVRKKLGYKRSST